MRRRIAVGLAILFLLGTSNGCAPKSGAVNEVVEALTAPAPLPVSRPLPATYKGVLPCADCAGIAYTLNLWGDKVFFLRRVYLGGDVSGRHTSDDIGTWNLSEKGTNLILHGNHTEPVQFEVKEANVLRKLDQQGKQIAPEENYNLVRTTDFEFFEPQLTLRGLYVSFAKSSVFKECLTGRPLPIVQTSDSPPFSAADLRARRQPDEPLLAMLEGQIVRRPHGEGVDEQDMLVVKRVLNVWPGATCGSSS